MSFSSVLQLVPVRYIITIMIFLGMLFNYMVRVNINLAIVAMVNHTALPHTNLSRSDECGGNGSVTPLQPQEDGKFVWDERMQGYILGAFYYGYVVTQLAGGRMAEVFSGKHTFGVAMFLSALLTLLTPVAAETDWRFLVAVRVVMGLVLGVTFPASYVLLSSWVPIGQMNLLVMLAQGGGDLGTTFTLPMTSAIIEGLGWEAVFYIQAGFVVVWFACWMVLVSDSPENHWFITDEERQLIAAGVGPRVTEIRHHSLPWRGILTSIPVWAYFVGYFGACWCYYSLLTDLPQYFSTMLGEDLSSNALFNSLPYLGLWLFTISFGYVSDKVASRGWAGPLAIRRTAAVVSILGPAALLTAIAFSGCQTSVVEALLVVTIILQGAGYNLGVLPLDLAPNYAGTLAGLANTLGAIPGFLGPLVVAALTEGNETLARWRTCFLIAAGLAGGCGLFLLVGCSVEEQPWNRMSGESSENDVKQEDGKLSMKSMAGKKRLDSDAGRSNPSFEENFI